MRHRKLPAVPPPTEAPTVPKPLDKNTDFFTDRATVDIPDTSRVYCIHLKLAGGGFSAFILLSHIKRFEQSIFNDMVVEALKVCNDIRIPARRQEMADQKTPVPNPAEINESLFGGDADFFEAVMCDKYGFKKLFMTAGEGIIVPTVKIEQ